MPRNDINNTAIDIHSLYFLGFFAGVIAALPFEVLKLMSFNLESLLRIRPLQRRKQVKHEDFPVNMQSDSNGMHKELADYKT